MFCKELYDIRLCKSALKKHKGTIFDKAETSLSKLCTVQILPDNDSLKFLIVQLQSIYPILKPIPCANYGLSRFDNTTLFQFGHCDVIKGDMAA